MITYIIHIIYQYYIWYPFDVFVDKLGFANYTKYGGKKGPDRGLIYCVNQSVAIDRSWYWSIHELMCVNMGYDVRELCLALWKMVKADETKEAIKTMAIYTCMHQISVEDPTIRDEWPPRVYKFVL